MPQMSPAQARVVDPILSSVAQGYQNNEFIGRKLFPVVPVSQRGGKIISFGKEDFMLYNTGRAPGQNTKRVQFGYSSGNYTLESHSLEGVLPRENMEEADAVPGIDLASVTVSKTQDIIALRLEKQQADLATNPANYGASNKVALSGTGQWSDFSGASDPVKDIEAGKEAVRKATGKRPNVVAMGATVFASLKQHPKVVDRMKYTGRDIATPELLAALFDVKEVVIGDAVFADDSGTFNDVWGKNVVLAYVDTAPAADRGRPTYGYTYQLDGYAIVEEAYFDRSAKSWVYPVTDEVAPVIAGALAGYLISAAVA
ncbi:MAG: major capsid protein [Burkholderiaceae bacterium]|nr:major capsid protein [Burkholderiaceae bacterium]